MNLYLDDIREAPEGWVRVQSVNKAWTLIVAGKVVNLSLDHDLGDYAHDGGDAIKLVLRMCEYNVWPAGNITIHSANPVGRANMQALIDRYRPT